MNLIICESILIENDMLAAIRKFRKEIRMKRFYGNLIPVNGLCFDIGANHGKYTALFSKRNAKIISVEPQQNCFDDLIKRFGNNKRVVLIQSAIGSEISKGTLHVGSNDEVSTLSEDFISAYSIYKHNLWKKQQEVNIITLDKLIAEYGIPDFCKLDIEGWEAEALKGLSQSLPLISFEYNSLLKIKAFQCVEILADNENYVFNFSAYENCEFYSEEWLEENKFSTFLNKLPADILHGDIFARLKK